MNSCTDISGYGIRLVPLSENTIELLRYWRNQSFIRNQMEYKEMISQAAQQQWFNSIKNNASFLYFIIYKNDKPIGMIHLSDIDNSKKVANVGLFVGDTEFLGTGVSLGASVLLIELAFEKLDLKKLYAKVKTTNTISIEYNAMLGFTFHKNINSDFHWYSLSKAEYIAKHPRLLKLLKYTS